jgi:hypothetical protein
MANQTKLTPKKKGETIQRVPFRTMTFFPWQTAQSAQVKRQQKIDGTSHKVHTKKSRNVGEAYGVTLFSGISILSSQNRREINAVSTRSER